MKNLKHYIKHILSHFSFAFWGGLGVWTISFFLPYVILGEDSYIRIHDTLEGELVWLHIMKQNGVMHSLLNEVKIAQLMHGLPRNVMPSGFTFIANICNVFGIFYGYIIGQYILKTIGYISFYLFIKKYMTLPRLNENVLVATSLLLTSIQFFTPFGLSVMGMPLLAFGFARLYYNKKSLATLLIFFTFPFFSSFVWSGIEMIILFNIYLVYLVIIKHDHVMKWIYAWIAFCVGTVLANIQFIYGMLFLKGFRSHRVAYNLYTEMPNFGRTISEFFGFFFSTHYHISIFISLLIFVLFLISYFGIEKNKWSKNIMKAIFLIVLWQAFYPFIEFLISDITFIKSFRFNRFAFLLPFLWFLILLISMNSIAKYRIWLRKTIPLIIFSQFLILFFSNDETAHNYKKLIGIDNFPSFKEYLALNSFSEIKKIAPPSIENKVISIGMSPTIAQYHGYSTLDGLFSVYDLDYKLEFRKIFEKELQKSNWKKKEYFDNWGNRCYVFPAEMQMETVANNMCAGDKEKLRYLELNMEQFKKMGGKYIFSAAEILNAKSMNLNLLKRISPANAYWVIYVYQYE
jgi:hypothetical protein